MGKLNALCRRLSSSPSTVYSWRFSSTFSVLAAHCSSTYLSNLKGCSGSGSVQVKASLFACFSHAPGRKGKCYCVLNHFGSFDSDWSFRALLEFGGRVVAAVQVYAIRQQNKKTHQRTHFFPSLPAKNSPILVTRAPASNPASANFIAIIWLPVGIRFASSSGDRCPEFP
ncbi:uncharacterized protein L203_102413 [Cryptococcus depauperatus CBS 7841]|uniref:Uncharacterized protein n=1 Tax=Cryptococcus depauperatus CBS 7841 TaxID=1295531 RepID=A0AAJ8JRW5_9TREE